AEQEARAVGEFLQDDLLAQADVNRQGGRPDPNLTVRTALDRAAGSVAGKFSSQPPLEGAVRYVIGRSYESLGMYAEAQGQLERALAIQRRVFGEQDPRTLASLHMLAVALWGGGKLAQSEAMFRQVVQLDRRILGEEAPDTLRAVGNLGSTLRA